MLENFTPLSNLVWIKPDAELEKTNGGIVIPERTDRQNNIGTVIKISKKAEQYLIRLYGLCDIAIGDKVMYDYCQSSEYTMDDEKIISINPIYIIAKILQ